MPMDSKRKEFWIEMSGQVSSDSFNRYVTSATTVTMNTWNDDIHEFSDLTRKTAVHVCRN